MKQTNDPVLLKDFTLDSSKENIALHMRQLQMRICEALEQADGLALFKEDPWERTGGGGGQTRVIQDGLIIEKGGVNYSAVFGETPPKIQAGLHLPDADFFATGVSIVMHPKHPRVPIIHMNIRYFELSDGTWWIGGGIDLTPHFVHEDDARFFHQKLKAVCDAHDVGYYEKFKTWADDYFYIKHRNETRGIGGIFFDRFNGEKEGKSKVKLLHFLFDVGNAFTSIYVPLIHKNKYLPILEKEKDWQLLRRGRYVEFNLVYDKGTKFGLDTDGRTESILMSLPPLAKWGYNYIPQLESEEAKTLSYLRKGISWIS